MTSYSRHVFAAIMAAAVLAPLPALAATEHFAAQLDSASEVPPTDSAGTGALDATYDTSSMQLNWTVTYSALSGPATAAHFHGPAPAGQNAKPVIPIKGSLASPIKGSATLTKAQQDDLEAGNWYFNVHTKKYPDGEIRGQLSKQ